MTISVVILNYNGREWLRKFLPAVIQHSSPAAIVVADNNSNDGSAELVATEFPAVRWIPIATNLGFCGGYNYALQRIEADTYVLLNSDVEVTAGWLTPVVEKMSANPSIGAAQPKILSFHNKDEFEYAGAGGGFIDSLGYPFCRGRIFDALEKDHGQYNDDRSVFWASGACLFVRAKLYHAMGGLDEDFFAHMEEIDLCWKLQRAGYTVEYVASSHVYHVGGGTLSKSNPRKTYYNFRNGLSLLFKHLPARELAWKFPARVALDWLAAGNFLLRGSAGDALAVGKAHAHFIAGLGNERRKKRRLKNKLPYHTLPGIYQGSIVVEYFLRGRKVFTDLKFRWTGSRSPE